jgi:hypothetical protein
MVSKLSREDVLAGVDVLRTLGMLGVIVTKAGSQWADCRCPLHQDTNPSFRVALEANGEHEKGFWMCMAENKHGSIFDLVIEMGQAKDFAEACKFLGAPLPERRQKGVPKQATKPEEPKVPKAPVVTEEDVQRSIANLRDEVEARRYLIEERGLDQATIEKCRIGFVRKNGMGAIVIPKPAAGEVQHWKWLPFPRPERQSGKLRFWHTEGADTSILFPHASFAKDEHVLVVESELDAALALSFGVSAVGNGGTSHYTVDALKPIWECGAVPILFPDNDEAGDKAMQKCLDQITDACLPFGVMNTPLPKNCKDLGDIVKEHGRAAVKDWLARAIPAVEVRMPRAGAKDVWDRLHMRDKDGESRVWKILTNLDIILAWDPRWRDRLWLNDLGHAMMLDGEPITDTTISNIRVAIQFDYEHDWGNENVFDRVKAACTARRVNPVSSYLRSLTWDGEGRLDHMDDYLSMPANQDLDLKRAYLRKFMIGAVARIMAPGCKMDTMLVLYSKRQGVGKSRFAAALAGAWFCDESLRPDDKDCKLTLHKSWIVEVSELDATTRRRDVAELRAFISRTEDTIRAPYGKLSETFQRHFVFLGTTNDMGVVKEDDGRRYWPIEVLEIDVPAIEAVRDQLWAEAVAAYKGGERWWLDTDKEAQRRADTEARFTDPDVAADCIAAFVEASQEPREAGVGIEDVSKHLRDCGLVVSRKELPGLLRKAGLEVRNVRVPLRAPRDQQKVLKRWAFVAAPGCATE